MEHNSGGLSYSSLNNNMFITDSFGTKKSYLNGKLHNEDGPAVIYSDGRQEWYINGKRHRVDNPAIIDNSTQAWWINDKLHREDGPAFILADGTQKWYLNGKLHRVDGPAIIYPNGYQGWWINGNKIFDAEIKEWQEQYNISQDYKKWDDRDKMLFKLWFS